MQTFNKPKIAVLKEFTLHLSNGTDVRLRNIKVVKDSQRHIVCLVGNPVKVTLVRVKRFEKLTVEEGVIRIPIVGTKRTRNVREIVWARYTSAVCVVHAFSTDLGIQDVTVPELPAFIERLLM